MFKLRTLGFLALFAAAPLAAPAAQAPQGLSKETKLLASLIGQIQGPYIKMSDDMWRVSYKSTHLKPLLVNVTTSENMVLFYVSLAARDKVPLSQNVLVKLLELNHHYDYVKICLNKEDIYVRGDLTADGLTPAAFEAFESQVALAADEIYGVLKGFLP